MKWLKKLFKEVVEEVEEEMFGSIGDHDLSDEELEELTKPVFGLHTHEMLNIPINIQIDGKALEPLSDEQERKIVDLAKNKALQTEVERYLGDQFKKLALLPEGQEADMLKGKIMGVSEFYRKLLEFEFVAREGVEQDTMMAEDAPAEVEHS
jgi:hypothetical protein